MTEPLAHRAGVYKALSTGFLFPDAEVAGLFHEDEASLVAEYNRIFLGERGVPLYECEFSCRNEFEKARHLADIAGFYHAFGVLPNQERPDHIASELEFLHLLVSKELRARQEAHGEHLEVTLEAERSFFREHLAGWAPRLIRAVRREAPPDGFYAQLCASLEDFLNQETERIGAAI